MAEKQNPIACEPCRQKKCKCDRTLYWPLLCSIVFDCPANLSRPVCSQCSDPARCVYPESGKRGLPQGYITHLENRLAATERALYSTYAYLRTISPRSFSVVESSQPPTSRIAVVNEWSRFPLRNPDDLELWFSEKARVFGVAGDNVSAEWSPETAGTNPKDRDGHASAPSLNSLSHQHVPLRPAGYPREGRAERLAELEPGIYF